MGKIHTRKVQFIQKIVPKKLLNEPEMIKVSALLVLASKPETKILSDIKTLDIKKEFQLRDQHHHLMR